MVDFYSERNVKWDNGSVVLIDQTKLPLKITHLRLLDYREIVEAIKNMQVRGAPAIGAAAAMGLALVVWHSTAEGIGRMISELEKAGEVMINVRPTAVNIRWAVERVMTRAKGVVDGVDDVRRAVVDEAIAIAEEDVAMNHSIGRNGSHLLKDGDRVLTHCKWFIFQPAECWSTSHRRIWYSSGCSQSCQRRGQMLTGVCN